jgi:hypothetical protein
VRHRNVGTEEGAIARAGLKPGWRCVGLTLEFAIELDLLQEGIAGST